MIRLSAAVVELPLAQQFRVSHTSVERVQLVTLQIVAGGHTGTGEVAVGPWLRELAEDVASAGTELATTLTQAHDMPALADIDAGLCAARDRGVGATTRMLVEMACLDLAARVAGQPLWRLLQLDEPAPVSLWRTLPVGGGRPSQRGQCYKVKLGSPDDRELLGALAGRGGGELIVDVNSGWDRTRWEAVRDRVIGAQLTALEDPVALVLSTGEGTELLFEVRATIGDVPVILDESVRTLDDIERVASHADGANVKLAKFGGLLESRRALERLRALGLRPLLGCFIEPPRAIAYAAQLAGVADWVDLDGHQWLYPAQYPSTTLRLEHARPGAPSLVTG